MSLLDHTSFQRLGSVAKKMPVLHQCQLSAKTQGSRIAIGLKIDKVGLLILCWRFFFFFSETGCIDNQQDDLCIEFSEFQRKIALVKK